MSTGSTSFPRDFDSARPCSSSVQPWRGDAVVGRTAASSHGAEQGRLKPSAILIAAFEIKIGGPGIDRLRGQARQHGWCLTPATHRRCRSRARNGVPPHFAHFGARGQNRIGFGRVPGIGAAAGKEFDHFAIDRRIVQRLAATLAEKYGDRHAPNTLPGDAPIGAGSDHVVHALFAPGRIPFHFLDFIQRPGTQGPARHRRFHGDEPLFGGSKDNRIVAPPAMWIGMHKLFRVQQRAAFPEQLDDGRIGGPDFQPVVLRQAVAHDAGCVHVAGEVELVLHAGVEVFPRRAMARCGQLRCRCPWSRSRQGHRESCGQETDAESSSAPSCRRRSARAPAVSFRLHFAGDFGSQPAPRRYTPRRPIRRLHSPRLDETPLPSKRGASREWWSR